jgi:hypothetical protein
MKIVIRSEEKALDYPHHPIKGADAILTITPLPTSF